MLVIRNLNFISVQSSTYMPNSARKNTKAKGTSTRFKWRASDDPLLPRCSFAVSPSYIMLIRWFFCLVHTDCRSRDLPQPSVGPPRLCLAQLMTISLHNLGVDYSYNCWLSLVKQKLIFH